MNTRRILPIGITIVLLALLAGGLAQAQGPAGAVLASPGSAPDAAPGPGFTYQGQLKDGAGNPIDSTCTLTFSLWDAGDAGNQVGGDCVVGGVIVADGYFTALVNQGGEFGAAAFDGQARWLGISVQCTGDASPVPLSPRQPLSAAPYAHYALQVPDHDHWGEAWTGSGYGLEVYGGEVGLSAGGSLWGVYALCETPTCIAMYGDAEASDGAGLYGRNTATTGTSYGVHGESFSPDGYGVYGQASSYGVYGSATAASGLTYGVYGESASTAGRAVYGRVAASTGETYGLYGRADSNDGTGVSGLATANSGTTRGVMGVANSTEGIGVLGWAARTTGSTYGVYGWASSTDGRGVYGEAPAYGVYGSATAASGLTYGVYGESASTAGRAVYGRVAASTGETYGLYGRADSNDGTGVSGLVTANSGTTRGVMGVANSTEGIGVLGWAASTTGATYGVYGWASSTDGRGVYGEAPTYGVYGSATAASGTTSGVYGESASTAGRAVYGRVAAATGTTYGLYGRAESNDGTGVAGLAASNSGTTRGVYGAANSSQGIGVLGWAGSTTGATYGVYGWASSPAGYGVYYVGGIGGTGLMAAIVETPAEGWRHLYAVASPRVLFEDVGTAQLVDGQAVVPIDPVFAQTVNLAQPYQVFLTGYGESPTILWVTAKTAASFTVRGVTLDGQAADVSFDYRLIATRMGYEETRLAPAAEPALAVPEVAP